MLAHLLASGVFLFACLGMGLTWSSPWVWGILVACLLLMLAISRDPRDLAFFGLGIALGGFIDILQTGSGVTVYRTPGPILLFPGYVLVYWGLVGVSLRHLYKVLPTASYHPLDGALFVGAIGLSLFGNLAPRGVALLMVLALAAHLAIVRRRGDGLAAIALMTIGPLTESVLIREGLYHFPSAGGNLITIWLYPLYACIGASFRGIVPILEGALARVDNRKPSTDG
ncbi:hypothetical protein D3C86_521780 [compost metagenome]